MSPGLVHDPDLLDVLEAMQPQRFEGAVWRVTWKTRDPLAGGTGGGRWHPANEFEALYTSADENGALAEAYHHLSRAPVFSSSDMTINRLNVAADRILVFPDIEALRSVGVSEEDFVRGRYGRTREIGSAARFLDLEGLVVPNARWTCLNLVLFPDRMHDRDGLEVAETRSVNWPAWRETVATAKGER